MNGIHSSSLRLQANDQETATLFACPLSHFIAANNTKEPNVINCRHFASLASHHNNIGGRERRPKRERARSNNKETKIPMARMLSPTDGCLIVVVIIVVVIIVVVIIVIIYRSDNDDGK
eukprot:scaffold151672_cov35-Attheya_sp.AAC.3